MLGSHYGRPEISRKLTVEQKDIMARGVSTGKFMHAERRTMSVIKARK